MVVEQTRAAAVSLLAALSPELSERIRAPFDTSDHQVWTYLPGDRPGVTLGELDQAQRGLAMRLVELGCSERGFADARSVLFAEAVRRGLAQTLPGSSVDLGAEQRYYLRILGDPSGDGPWAWRINGHHLALHVTVVDGSLGITPQFFGAEPALVLSGPHEGFRALPIEQDLGFKLLDSLQPDQRAVAVFSEVAPDDILTRYDPIADPAVLRRGLPYGDMDPAQRALFSRLIGQYVGRAADPIGQRAWKEITDHGIEQVSFAWAGGAEPGIGHYYSIAGPTFLAEYDNTQDDANHIHSVWRDLQNDWGRDLLSEHYASHQA